MRNFVLIVLKTLLAGFFLYNIGFFSLFSKMDNDPSPPIKADRGREDVRYLNEKVNHAQSLGIDYGPELYFADLAEINSKLKRNDFDRFAVIAANSTEMELLALFHKNVAKHRQHDSRANYNSFMARLSRAQKRSENIFNPGAEQKEAIFRANIHSLAFWLNLLTSLFAWLGNFYWHNLPLAFFLIWLWWYQDKEKIRINNPLSFFICLVFYPVVIGRVWFQQSKFVARALAMNIEFKRRQVNFFALISENELADIERFAKSNLKISDYRRYLENRLLVRRHAFLPVMFVTLIFLLSPKISGFNDVSFSANHQVMEYHQATVAPPGSSFGQSNDNDNQSISAIISVDCLIIFSIFLSEKLGIPPIPRQNSGFRFLQEPIPLVC